MDNLYALSCHQLVFILNCSVLEGIFKKIDILFLYFDQSRDLKGGLDEPQKTF